MAGDYSLVIDVPGRTLQVELGGRRYSSYPVAVGKPSTPTPRGTFTIVEKILHPGSVYGTRLLALSKPYYSIHGTNAPELIGQAVSNGCVRMYNQQVEEVYSLVDLGTPVYIPKGAEHWHEADPGKMEKPSGRRVYYVRPGDSLWSIAQAHRTRVEEILRHNPSIHNPDHLFPGQEIWLP